MNLNPELFLDKIDQKIQSKHLLKHPFYQAWSKGELSLECLKEYAKDYYEHVKAFPTYISAIHSRSEDPETRKILLQNLIEEEAGSPNHPELWKQFTLSLGVKEEDLLTHKTSDEMVSMISCFQQICRQKSTAEGISSLYAYESQIPEISTSKIQGLQEHYNLKNPKDWEYFKVHIDADKEHAAQERLLLKKYINRTNHEAIEVSLNETLDSLWNFLSGLCKKYNISMCCSIS